MEEPSMYYIPQTVFPVRVPASAYAELVARVSAGYVTTTKEIEKLLCHQYGAEAIELDGPTPRFVNRETGQVCLFPAEVPSPTDGNEFDMLPFHRVLSERGYVQDTRFISREYAMKMLASEGHEIQRVGKGYRVEGYKDRLYDFRSDLMLVEGTVK